MHRIIAAEIRLIWTFREQEGERVVLHLLTNNFHGGWCVSSVYTWTACHPGRVIDDASRSPAAKHDTPTLIIQEQNRDSSVVQVWNVNPNKAG